MDYIVRNIDNELLAWKNATQRKPILLRGARQVGKSSVVRNLSKQFSSYVEVNFDMNPQIAQVFERDLNPLRICEELSVLYGVAIQSGKTLLFFDEVQACPQAISSLRYFYENMPQLHLIAAGSLLEFALENLQSYGVGRIRSMYLYPFSFQEFLIATQNTLLQQAIQHAGATHPLSEAIHSKAIDLYKRFVIIGGMPQVVSEYVRTQDLLACQRVLDDIVISYEDDFAKYKKKISSFIISEVFKMVCKQLGGKFMYSKSMQHFTNVQIKEALRLLQMAGLVYPVTHSSCNGVPLASSVNHKITKYIVFDTGIFQRTQKLQLADVLLSNSLHLQNIGALAEQFVGLELIKYASCYEPQSLYYWHRESRNSQAEVDYVIQQQNRIVPIEVKSGRSGSMQSIHLFMSEKQSELGIRISLENFSVLDTVQTIPLYAIQNITTKHF